MATSTLIQYLESAQVTGLGVSAPVGASTMDRSQVETFIAGASVTAGDWLMFDTSKTGANKVLTVIQCTNVALGNPLVVGVALNTAATGEKVKVVVSGYVASANVDAGVAAGNSLVVDTTAGRAHAGATGDIGFCGAALTAAVANKAECWIFKKF